MIKKKSRTLAFLLAASLIMPTIEGSVLAVANEENSIAQETSVNIDSVNENTETEPQKIFESGEGTKEDPYIINSVKQLKNFRDSVNNGTNYLGKYIKLNASIDLSEENWEPIGNKEHPFRGIFDGGSRKGVKISNLKIEKKDGEYIGLFGELSDPTDTPKQPTSKIEYLTIENVDITAKKYVAAVVGEGFRGEISNVRIEGDINIEGVERVAGISGSGYANINNCNISAKEESNINATIKYAGGIIGWQGEDIGKSISNCTVENLKITGGDSLGGISGIIQKKNVIFGCNLKNTTIKSNSDKSIKIGTIAGLNQGNKGKVQILDCEVINTYAYINNSDEPLTQKVSMIGYGEGEDVKENVIVGSNVVEKNGKVVGGEFEILTSDMYDSESLKLGDIGNDKYILVPKDTVAIVGEQTYSSLNDAITNCAPNQIVKLVDTVELNYTLNITNKNSITIDFNKQEVKASTNFKGDSLINIEDSKDISLHNGNFVIGDKAGKAIELNNSSASMNGDFNTTTDGQNKATTAEVNNGAVLNLGNLSSINGNDKSNLEEKDILKNGGTIEGDGNSTPSYPSKPSKPVYTHEEIIGSDRYDTAAKIADKLGTYDNVVLVNASSTMSDGLSASGLAGKENGAILLTKKDSIPKVTMDRIKKVKKVYIIGGESAISQKVYNEITKNVPNVKIERLGGKTRVETSELVAKKLGNYNKAFVVNGFKGEADAMSASSVAAKNGAPILLTNGKTSTHSKKSNVEYYVIGGNNVVDKSIATKYDAEVLAGSDRYATNREVINEFYGASETLYFANGETLVDALTASTIAKDDGLVLVGRKSDNKILNRKNTIQVGGIKFDVNFVK